MNIAILILAAGEAKRMGSPDHHKLLALLNDEPLVRRVAQQALASLASSVTVVTGHRHDAIEAALAGLSASTIHNPAYAQGMGLSLATGIRAPGIQDADGLLLMLADMPNVTSRHLDSLMASFRACKGRSIVRGCATGRPGHPVILPRSLFNEVGNLQGDIGARDVIVNSTIPVTLVEIGQASVQDIDTLEDLLAAGGRLPDGRI